MATLGFPRNANIEELAIHALSLLPDIPGAVMNDSATLTWRVDNWGTTTGAVRSPHFMCNGIKWRLLCYPRGSPASRTPNSVSIYLDRGNFGQNTYLPPVCVQFSLVVSNPNDPFNSVNQTLAKRIGLGEVLCGFDVFCTADQVQQAGNGNGVPIVRSGEADVTVFLRIMEDPSGELWMTGVPAPQRVPSPFEGAPVRNSESIPSASAAAAAAFDDPTPEKKPLPTRAAYPGEECMVCADEPLLFPAKPPTALCSHEARVCISCLQDHLASEFAIKGAIYAFACPAPDCHEVLDYNEFKFWSSSATFIRYDRALMRQALGLDDNFVMCTNAKCDAGQIHSEGANAPIVTCYACHHRTCFTHQVAWHEGHTCEEWDQHQKTRVGIATTDEYLSKYTKDCPNCHKPIEKYTGCDSLTCKLPAGCGHTFCWLCLAPYDAILRDGNHRHYPQCKHYAAWDDPSSKTKISFSATTAAPSYSAPTPSPYTVTPYTYSSTSAPVMASGSGLNTYQTVVGTSSSASNPPPPPYTSYPIASTSHTGKKWYRFWKDR